MRLIPRSYDLLADACTAAANFAVGGAYKHLEEGQHPTREDLADHLDRELWVALEERFIIEMEDDRG